MKKESNPTLGFIGQGYVGKSYADEFERRGYSVIRYSLEEEYRNNKENIKTCGTVFIAVPTPTTPEGSDTSIVEGALRLVEKGSIAVIKSTILPGVTKRLQKAFSDLVILFSPEFLSGATAAYEAAHPFINILGVPVEDKVHQEAAEQVMKLLPRAELEQVCDSTEAELIKYAHNVSAYIQIVFFNLLYDLAQKTGAAWEPIEKAIKADPFIPNRYASPLHKSGRGAGGHCFIKDFAAFRDLFEKLLPGDAGVDFLRGVEKKNLTLLTKSGKDTSLLSSIYGSPLS